MRPLAQLPKGEPCTTEKVAACGISEARRVSQACAAGIASKRVLIKCRRQLGHTHSQYMEHPFHAAARTKKRLLSTNRRFQKETVLARGRPKHRSLPWLGTRQVLD